MVSDKIPHLPVSLSERQRPALPTAVAAARASISTAAPPLRSCVPAINRRARCGGAGARAGPQKFLDRSDAPADPRTDARHARAADWLSVIRLSDTWKTDVTFRPSALVAAAACAPPRSP